MSHEARIGVFEGRKGTYNMAILEVLLRYGPLTNWEISKKLCQLVKEAPGPDFYQSQKIFSVIARKQGRLEELDQKEYIVSQDGKWELCFPKGLAILIKKPEIGPDMNVYYLRKPPFNFPKFKQVKKLKLPFGLKLQVDPKQLESAINNFMASLNIRKVHSFMARRLHDLIQEGIDLDRIRNENLALLVFQDMKGSESWGAVKN